MFNFDLADCIDSFLTKMPVCREYDILHHLIDIKRLPKDALKTPLALFRSHFLVFNALYRLQLQYLVTSTATLTISALKIERTAITNNHVEPSGSLSHHDALSCFYLDLNHLNNTESHDVQRLLEQFWDKFFTPTLKEEALTTLELSEPVDLKTIKQQYRRLAMRHHPDRGGDADKLIAITQAVQCLEQYY